MADGNCDECGNLNTTEIATSGGPGSCAWSASFPDYCEIVGDYQMDIYFDPQTCKHVIHAILISASIPAWENADVAMDDCLNAGGHDLAALTTSPDDCDWGSATIHVTPVLPDDAADFDLADCFNYEPCPNPTLPENAPVRSPATGCRSSAAVAAVPAADRDPARPTRPTATSASIWPPVGRSPALTGGVALNTGPRSSNTAPSGNNTAGLGNQYVDEIDDYTVDRHRCDGAKHRYACKSQNGQQAESARGPAPRR